MSILDRFRRTSAFSTDEPYYGEVVQHSSRPDEVTAYYKEMDLGQQTELIRAAAASPFTGTTDKTAGVFIDPTIYRMMVSAEKMIERNGDVKEGILAKIDFASGGLIVSHGDPSIQAKYKAFFDRVDMNALVEDTWLTEEIYGNAYLVSALVDGSVSFFALNPKRTAVGRQLTVGGRPYAYFDHATRKEFHSMGLAWGAAEWNEWPEFNPTGTQAATLIDPTRIYHRHARIPSFERYAIPAAVGAWEAFTDRMSLGELTRNTIDGLKTQIRVWRIQRPQPGELAKLKTTLDSADTSRTYDLVWSDSLQAVQHVVPASIDALLANETWMRMTRRVFFDMGMSMILSGGDVDVGQSSDVETIVAVALSRLVADLRQNCRVAAWAAEQYVLLEEPGLAKYGPPSITYIEPLISQQYAIKGIAPLLNYGGISIHTALQKMGYDPEVEFAKLEREMPLRGEGKVIYPYPSFGQVGPYGQTTSQQSQGRPPGEDLDPDHAETNSENARG